MKKKKIDINYLTPSIVNAESQTVYVFEFNGISIKNFSNRNNKGKDNIVLKKVKKNLIIAIEDQEVVVIKDFYDTEGLHLKAMAGFTQPIRALWYRSRWTQALGHQ